MTLSQLTRALWEGGIPDAAYEAARLLQHFAKVTPAALAAEPDREYDAPSLDEALSRRLAHEPLQYILGEWDFYRQSYLVSPHCLIPRSDTEILVEEAIRLLPPGARFADLCTGSGCIAISTLAERPDTVALAVEKFPETLEVAKANAVRNRVNARFTPCLLDLLAPDATLPGAPYDAILSNPPYIPAAVVDTLAPEVQREPRAALDGGDDGLDFYRVLFSRFANFLTPTGWFLLEIGYNQAESVSRLARESGFAELRVVRDYGGHNRVIYATRQ